MPRLISLFAIVKTFPQTIYLIFCERINLDGRSLILLGEDPETTIIDADGNGLVVNLDNQGSATVIDGFAETDQMARFDVEPTMLVSVFRTGDQSALDIADADNPVRS